jgi:hypothetical protein
MRTFFDIRRDTCFFASPRTTARALQRALAGCRAILDVGCGASSPLRYVSCERLVGVDAFQPDLDRARAAGTHDEFVLARGQDLAARYRAGEFDACVALDVIEHFAKDDGFAFLNTLETIAAHKVVIFTPNGFLPQAAREPGDFQEHLSGWTPAEMRARGYEVTGLVGLKSLRTTQHRLRFRPKFFWAIVSWLTQHLWCRRHPESAAGILCVKTKP